MAGGSLAAKSGPVPASSALITYAFASRRATSGDGGVDRSMRRLIPLPLLITALPSGLRQRAPVVDTSCRVRRPGRSVPLGGSDDDFAGLLGFQQVCVDDQVVVRGQLALDPVE